MMGSKVTQRTQRRRILALALVVAAVAGTGYAATTAAGKTQAEPVTLTISLFGDFGYHDLYKQYEQTHPGVTIKESIQDFAVHHSNLAKSVATGAGAADIEAIEVGFIAQFKAQPDRFVNLRQYGAGSLKDRWLPWKWQQGLASKGQVVGLGTDVGSLAICYRRDLFQKAGLPTNRAAVSKLWPTWQAFVATGKRFQANAPKGVSFFDSGSNVYNAIIGQATPAYYDASGKVIAATNPKVKAAWDLTMQGIAAKESAGFAAFSNDWNTGYKKGSFATVTCPAWMMGYIQGQAPNTKGKWDIASVPGTGGNWGGSYLAVPEQSKNAAQAADLVKFLTSPASEAYIFKQTGNLPSQPALLKSKAVAGFKNPFFNNAPVGQIFAASALRLKPQIIGPQQGAIQTASSNAIQRVEQGKQSPAKSWSQFLKDVKAVT
jgi:cellobiose transport system substrate-binding protein